MSKPGTFVISLDFELYWGVRDKTTIDEYKDNLLGVRQAVPALLDLFQEYQIHATWSVVGFLFARTKEELFRAIPLKKPRYVNPYLSPYHTLHEIGMNEQEDPFHFAPSLIEKILSYPNQTIGTHTFSHYYCLEKGQNMETFRDDLLSAIQIASTYNVRLESLVFPRNQFNGEYLSICEELGIKCYRGNPSSWIYRANNQEDPSLLKRLARFCDAYINISGHNCHSFEKIKSAYPFDIPASRFLRPYWSRLDMFESLRLKRIQSDLTYAAKNGLVYHLWWHPYNFGVNLEKNLSFLKKILAHYGKLRMEYGMNSLNMEQIADRLLEENRNKQAG
ncbi:polysaccharide deacetylase family protein [Effusibacillus lacus]|uniref:NodB homology domain-containing protein n=1 Tax=Effusibacillus lacus TaxID=1348429 RepID=A0A292YLX3_9BACL|nr:polysaccharide deacetylase family protein [Effusibacillus lacus]TCS70819.1 polysaccharide deacetylase [Effusibacillus lacus]GAX89384.1 hypothetical protein EFBL_1002 [Effusibacillus lacus]